MRTLYLLRHAKSSWEDDALEDYERPLDERGQRAASVVGALLAQVGARVDLVLCSSAARARETAERLAHMTELPQPTVEDELYLASAGDLLDRLRRIPGSVSSVMLIGHNPGLGDLACTLGTDGDRADRQRMARKFPTGGLAIFDVGDPAGWSDLAPGGCELVRFIAPKDLV